MRGCGAAAYRRRGVSDFDTKRLPERPDVIERQLAHQERNEVRGAYNRAEYLPERTKMMQAWADYLEVIASGAKVIPFGQAA